ncbi:hypothetical protein BGZ46_002730 [Entomortierella lignicola]|nr:hypothetical protein BGZ46_002730 [Entomortierella lignicola]
MEPLSTNETPFNASFELHRVDLAHGSFFALHRPLLGIANGPMFANNQGNNMMNEEDYEGKFFNPVEDLTSYFSTLQPYSPPTPPLLQPSVGTPTATSWASLPQSLMDAEQTVDEFLSQIQVQQQQKSDYTMDTETPNNSPNKSNSENSFQNDSISVAAPTTESILDPLLDQRNMMHLTSVLRKRRIKMRKHKYKKLRKRTRALRKKLGK